MPYDDPDPTDPMTLTGVELAVDDDSSLRDMARCFIEEFARLGLSEPALLEIFERGDYAGPARATRAMGRDAIRAMIHEEFLLRGPRARRVVMDRRPDGSWSLPVFE